MSGGSLRSHLRMLGIRHFEDESYWKWGGVELQRILSSKELKTFERLRRRLGQAETSADRAAFYDFCSRPAVAAVVHSMKSDAIHASGTAIVESLHGSAHILDIGCNSGYLTTWYAKSFPEARVTGIDVVPSCIKAARRCARELGLTNVEFLEGSPEVACNGREFDAIVDSQSVFEATDRAAVLRWVAKSLARHGTYISVPQTPTEADLRQFLADIADAGLFVRQFAVASFADAGEVGAYPVLVIGLDAAPELDVDECFDALRSSMVQRRP